jgi:hypothetical protein
VKNPSSDAASGSKSMKEMYIITPEEKLSMCPSATKDGFPYNTTIIPPS